MHAKHLWKAKILVSVLMLMLAFLGLIISDLHLDGGWIYWKWIVFAYALLALGLSFYTRKSEQKMSAVTIAHELFHWLGVIFAVFAVTFLVNHGVISRFDAGIFDLILLSLGVFLAGVYIEHTFFVVGITLSLMAIVTGLLVQYMYAIIIPLLLVSFFIIVFVVWHKHRNLENK